MPPQRLVAQRDQQRFEGNKLILVTAKVAATLTVTSPQHLPGWEIHAPVTVLGCLNECLNE